LWKCGRSLPEHRDGRRPTVTPRLPGCPACPHYANGHTLKADAICHGPRMFGRLGGAMPPPSQQLGGAIIPRVCPKQTPPKAQAAAATAVTLHRQCACGAASHGGRAMLLPISAWPAGFAGPVRKEPRCCFMRASCGDVSPALFFCGGVGRTGVGSAAAPTPCHPVAGPATTGQARPARSIFAARRGRCE
jgi:hypothetical protein